MGCIVLYCIAKDVLYCIVLYCIAKDVLHCIVLYCKGCIVLYCIVLQRMYCIVLYCIVLLTHSISYYDAVRRRDMDVLTATHNDSTKVVKPPKLSNMFMQLRKVRGKGAGWVCCFHFLSIHLIYLIPFRAIVFHSILSHSTSFYSLSLHSILFCRFAIIRV